MSCSGMRVEAIPESRFEEVIEHLRFNFFADEPLNNGVGLCRKGEAHEDLEKHCLATLQQGYSRMLVTDNETIAGLVLNGILKRSDSEDYDRRLLETGDGKFTIIFGLLNKLNQQIDLFAKYGVDEIFDCRILSVDEEFRGKGLAHVLMKDSVEVAKNAGFKVFKADATGIFSQSVFSKHGFDTVAELLYSELDEKIRPKPPHKSVKLMVKILN